MRLAKVRMSKHTRTMITVEEEEEEDELHSTNDVLSTLYVLTLI